MMEQKIHFVEKKNTGFEEFQNLCAAAEDIFWVDSQLVDDGLLPKSSRDGQD